MAKQTTIDEKEETPAQGAGGTSETSQEVAGTLLVAETPEWVAELLESNKAVIQSVSDFRESANALIEKIISASGPEEQAMQVAKPAEFNPYADYKVAEGKEFRAPNDFTTVHEEGDNVTHLGASVLTRLLEQGLVTEVDPED